MNIALYGGSFDPPHLGHVHVVHAALETLDIDKVIVVPAFVNPFKNGTHAPAELRLKWLQKIFKDDKNVDVSDIEVTQNRAVRSIETVAQLADKYEKIYFIIGADNLAALEQWHRFDVLNTLVTWVVATRDRIEIDDGYISVLEANNAGKYLYNMPLFASFWTSEQQGFNRIILAVVPKSQTNRALQKLNVLIEDLPQHKGVMAMVQDLFFSIGSLDV